jgi:hypothetical protein
MDIELRKEHIGTYTMGVFSMSIRCKKYKNIKSYAIEGIFL